jgi:hypothetical protein
VSGVVEEEQISFAVAVEIGGALETPSGGSVDRADLRIGADLGAVHLQDRDAVGGLIEEQQIDLAVGVEITLCRIVPARRNGRELGTRGDLRAVHLPLGHAVGDGIREEQIRRR